MRCRLGFKRPRFSWRSFRVGTAVVVASKLVLSAGASQSLGVAFSVNVIAKNAANATATSYGGTVHMTSTDGTATLPSNNTLIAGLGTFSVTINTVGTYTVTGTDTVTATITGVTGNIVVTVPQFSNLIWSDDFTRTNGTTLDTIGYDNADASAFAVFSNTAGLQSGTQKAAVTPLATSNVTAQVDMSGSSGGGVCLRFTDSSNYWICRVNGNDLEIVSVQSGSQNVRATVVVGPNLGGTVIGTASGNQIWASFNGIGVTYASSFNASATEHGIYAESGTDIFDNLLIYS